MNSDATLDVNVHTKPGGEHAAPNQQRLSEGWNLIGQYQEYDQDVSTALSSINDGSVYKLLAQEDSSNAYEYESYNAGDFDTMERGEGYWLFVQDDEVYTEATAEDAEATA